LGGLIQLRCVWLSTLGQIPLPPKSLQHCGHSADVGENTISHHRPPSQAGNMRDPMTSYPKYVRLGALLLQITDLSSSFSWTLVRLKLGFHALISNSMITGRQYSINLLIDS
jgi:hypothetical protein